jgi:preprotein translocase subunit SecA
VTKVMRVKLQKESEIERLEREDYERHQRAAQSLQLRHGGELAEGEEGEAGAHGQSAAPPPPRRAPSVAPVKRETPKIGRNDLCPCGSGEKFKKCHGAALEEEGSDDAQA